MTPARLNELRCPECQQVSWFIDSDYRGMDGGELPYDKRWYSCPHCRRDRQGWTLGQQSPPEFFLQPHDLYPMTQADFDYWVGILRTHHPEHRALSKLGKTFFPRLPKDAEAITQAHADAHPVFEMRDQDGARRQNPDLRSAGEWLEIMKPGDTLEFRRRDGGALHLKLDASGFSGSCLGRTGAVLSQSKDLSEQGAHDTIQRYLSGESTAFGRNRQAGGGLLSRIWNQIINPS